MFNGHPRAVSRGFSSLLGVLWGFKGLPRHFRGVPEDLKGVQRIGATLQECSRDVPEDF